MNGRGNLITIQCYFIDTSLYKILFIDTVINNIDVYDRYNQFIDKMTLTQIYLLFVDMVIDSY